MKRYSPAMANDWGDDEATMVEDPAGEYVCVRDIPQWQPIETAPKDGTSVLVQSGQEVFVAWYGMPGNRRIPGPRWLVFDPPDWYYSIYLGLVGNLDYEEYPEPHLWQPLPEPKK